MTILRLRSLHYPSINPRLALALGLACISTACSFQQYQAKPLDPAAIKQRLLDKDPNSTQFQQYLATNNYPAAQWPIQTWGLDELIYCALFFNPNLDVARAQLRAAEVAQISASERPVPSANGNIAHSNLANGDMRPYALGLSIDIPIETANKRDIRIDSARHLSEVAKLEIAQTAWQLRNQIATTYNEYQLNRKLLRLLETEQAYRQEIVNIYQKRLSLGAASSSELDISKLQLQSIQSELNAKQREQLILQAKFASNLGLPLIKVQNMQLAESSAPPHTNTLLPDSQSAALLNRLDIRIALERYAVAESKLKLEIAKQYPDITLGPGYAYEFGDKVWSLGISGLLSMLNKNKGAIAEAEQLRTVEAAQFEALQTKVINDASVANALYAQAQAFVQHQQTIHDQQLSNAARVQRRFNAGDADRLELVLSKLENIDAEKALILAQSQQAMALTALEDTLQESLLPSNKNPDLAISSRAE